MEIPRHLSGPVAGVGVDLIRVKRVARAYRRRPARFLQRIYSSRERDALAERDYPLTSLASRFAAKEAVAKALGCGIGPVRWSELEILQGKKGEPVVRLLGAAAGLARRQKIAGVAVSLAHDGAFALAFAVAYRTRSVVLPLDG
ncbi:MAG TPA: holo-[acyl-carrier-protein] synthase [Firmicutes bacterium]|nr:holo-[acyl-carrier-protein] synthase [Bacillota bacterium]